MFTFHVSICQGEVKAYSKTDQTWIKTINCTSYTIIFNIPNEANDVEYDIMDKNGKRVGKLQNRQGFSLISFFLNFKDVKMLRNLSGI